MFKITAENFDNVIEELLSLASSYGDTGIGSPKGIIFDKPGNRLLIGNVTFIVDIRDVEVDIPVDPANSFFDLLSGTWKPIPTKDHPRDLIENSIKKAKFVGCTTYYAKNIMKVIEREMDKVILGRTRYIFAGGKIPDAYLCATFNIIAGEPVFSIKGLNKKFVISKDSMIPKQFIKEETYFCDFEDMGDTVVLNVIGKYGKTRSGLHTSEIYFDGRTLGAVNVLADIHPELTTCSNELDIKADDDGKLLSMPPIHISTMLVYDILQTLRLCKESSFKLHFQEKTGTDVMIESVSAHPDDPKIFAYFGVIDLNKGIKNA